MFRYTEEDEIKPINTSKNIKDNSITGDGETISIIFGKNKLGQSRPGYNIVYLHKNSARKMLKNAEELLRYFYAG